MLKIRLQRIGKKNRPHYRLVVSEKKKDMYGDHKEILGNYDPIAEPKVSELKADRIKYWLSVGAQPSATVHNLLVGQKIIEAKKVKAWTPKKKESEDQPTEEKTEQPEAASEEKAEEAPAEEAPKEEEKKEDAAS